MSGSRAQFLIQGGGGGGGEGGGMLRPGKETREQTTRYRWRRNEGILQILLTTEVNGGKWATTCTDACSINWPKHIALPPAQDVNILSRYTEVIKDVLVLHTSMLPFIQAPLLII